MNSSRVRLYTEGISLLQRAGSGLGVPSALICSILVTRANPLGTERYDHLLRYCAASNADSSFSATWLSLVAPVRVRSQLDGITVSAEARGGGHGKAGAGRRSAPREGGSSGAGAGAEAGSSGAG